MTQSIPTQSVHDAIGALGSSEAVFRALVAHTPVGVFVSRANGDCEYVNDRWCELAGLTAAEALGAGWARALHPDDVERVTREWSEAGAAGRESIVEYRFLRPDGGVAWIQGFASPVRDERGEIVRWVGACLDLTASRESEAAVALTSERFRAAFDNAPIGMALVSPEGRWLQANEALCRSLGYDEEELQRLTYRDVLHPDDRAESAAATAQQYGDERRHRTEERFVRADGETVWVIVNSTLVRDGDGMPRYSVAQVEDVTERVRTHRELEEAEERFRRAFDDAPIGMGLVALDGRWLRANHALSEITGYEESELLELTFQDITHPDDLDADVEQGDRLLAGEIRAFQMEKRYIRKDGEIVWIMLSVSLARRTDGEPLYFVSQVEDITERKRADNALKQLAERDSLTGLLNRRRFHEDLQRECARGARRPDLRSALLILDIDRFKDVNDAHGHNAGDDVLRAVASTLTRRLRATDVAARIGGDEFAALLVDVGPPAAAEQVAGDIAFALREQAILTSSGPVAVTVSIGIAMLDPTVGDSEEQALIAADRAMYRAKQAGRDRIALAA